jgi:DNA-directed RNA polymerase subunit L
MKFTSLTFDSKFNLGKFDVEYSYGPGLFKSFRNVMEQYIPRYSLCDIEIKNVKSDYKPEQIVHKIRLININQKLKNFNYDNYKFNVNLKNNNNNRAVVLAKNLLDKRLCVENIFLMTFEPTWEMNISGKLKKSTKYIENNGYHNVISNISQKPIVENKKYKIEIQLLECFEFKTLLDLTMSKMIDLFTDFYKIVDKITIDDTVTNGKLFMTDNPIYDSTIYEPIKNRLSTKPKEVWCGYAPEHPRSNIYVLTIIDSVYHDESNILKYAINDILNTLKKIKKNINNTNIQTMKKMNVTDNFNYSKVYSTLKVTTL